MNNKAYYLYLNELLQKGEPLWQVSVIAAEGSTPAKPGMKMLIPLKTKELGNLGGGELEHRIISEVRSLQPEQPRERSFLLSEQGETAQAEEDTPTSMLCGGRVRVFIEPLFSSQRLYIIGAGHCGKALGALAKRCGYFVILLDDRPDLLSELPADCFDEAVLSDYGDLETKVRFDPKVNIVIMTHGHAHDKEVLQFCLRQPFNYLGMIGSKTKVAATWELLRQQGFSAEELAKVHAPIGLPIGSQSPDEIAVSIMAELITHNNTK